MIVTGKGNNYAPNNILSGNTKEKVGKETPQYELFMDTLETLFSTKEDKAHGNTYEDIVERFIKLRASTIFGHLVYSLDGPGKSIVI